MIEADRILQGLIVSEKASDLTAHLNQYTLRVHPDANRTSVARAIEKTWGVTVRRVNIVKVKPKAKSNRLRKGNAGAKPGYKKAIVTLKAGDAIEIV